MMAQPRRIIPSQIFASQKGIFSSVTWERLVDRKTVDLVSMHKRNAIVEQLVEKALSDTKCQRPPIGEMAASLKL